MKIIYLQYLTIVFNGSFHSTYNKSIISFSPSLQPIAGYDLLWLCSPSWAYDLLVYRFLITHDAPQSVGLLWTSDQLVAETST
jgi:hypothetical protein